MNYILQVFAGPWGTALYEPEQIIRKIGQVSSRLRVEKVIIGWQTDPSVYRKVGAFLHASGIQMLLWLPVFAETGRISEPDGALDIFGKKVVSPVQDEGADFLFGCPSSPRNLQIVKDLYENSFSGCGFDGVFLDRVRSQSFVSGVSGVLSCGCARCRKAFLDRGVDIGAVRELYARKKDSFFDLASFPPDGQFILSDGLAQRFFEVKEEIIAGAVADLCGYFRARGLAVGLDLFAPLVSRFVGQNYALITRNADFIKPMLYRRTEAPAGIGYEYALFENNAPGAAGRPGFSMDKAFLDTQLEAVGRVSCGKYPGIEINFADRIVPTDPAYITESLSMIRDRGFEGAVLSWNVMEAPEAHIAALGKASF